VNLPVAGHSLWEQRAVLPGLQRGDGSSGRTRSPAIIFIAVIGLGAAITRFFERDKPSAGA